MLEWPSPLFFSPVWKNPRQLALAAKRRVPSNAAAAPFSAGCKHTARAQSSAESPRSRFNQGRCLDQVVHSERKGVHLVVESAMRKFVQTPKPTPRATPRSQRA